MTIDHKEHEAGALRLHKEKAGLIVCFVQAHIVRPLCPLWLVSDSPYL
jgi:hypothetical protein